MNISACDIAIVLALLANVLALVIITFLAWDWRASRDAGKRLIAEALDERGYLPNAWDNPPRRPR